LFAELAAPQFEYIPAGTFVGLSRRSGHEGFIRFLETFWDEFHEAHAELQQLVDAGNSVVAHVTFHGKGRQSHVDVQMDLFQVWTFDDDGKMRRGQGFASREDALEAAGLRE
jgi:ketosteroid isomerase-like protein